MIASRTFNIDKDYCGVGCNIYKKNTITIKSGITILVGCNGIGKSTLIMQLKDQFDQDGTPYIHFDNLRDGGANARSTAGFRGDFDFLATASFASEGENIFMNMNKFAGKIVNFVSTNKSDKGLWIFMDAVDSGYSVDNIIDIKNFINLILKDFGMVNDIYFIISANEYELARNESCFDVYRGKYITFDSYDEYRGFIIKTREEKDKRKYKKRGENK